jgi:hypothetical protein
MHSRRVIGAQAADVESTTDTVRYGELVLAYANDLVRRATASR